MRRSSLLLAGLLVLLTAGGCSKQRPGGRRSPTAETPPKGPRRPDPARLTPEAGRIPPPPLRLDARVQPAELAWLPAGAPLVLAGRADLLDRLLQPRGWLAQRLPRIPGWSSVTAQVPAGEAPSRRLGLDPRRQWVAALFQVPAPEAKVLEAALAQRTATRPGPPTPAPPTTAWPPLRLRFRLVAALANPAATRATLRGLATAAASLGWKDLYPADHRALPGPLRALAPRAAQLIWYAPDGVALVAWIRGTHLVIDAILTVSGPWSPAVAASLLPPPRPASPAAAPQDDPFGKVVLLAGADLTVLVDAPALAEAACWVGMREAFRALPQAPATRRSELLQLAWRIARIPRTFAQVTPAPFDRFAVLAHLTERRPLLTLAWRLTPTGQGLVSDVAKPLTGRDLGRGRRFVDEWLRPLAAAVPKALPPVGPWKDADLPRRLQEGGGFGHLIALAGYWPRLLPLRAVRKAVLGFARGTLRLDRFVGRVNLERQGKLLRLRLEGRPLSAAGAGGRQPPGPPGRPRGQKPRRPRPDRGSAPP